MTPPEPSSAPGVPRPFVSSDRVRWADVDLVGIMRFSAFTRLVENAEQDLSREAGLGYQEVMDNPSVWMPRKKLTIEYMVPARIDDELRLVTYVSRVGESSVVINVDVMTADFSQLCAAAEMVTVSVSAKTFTKIPLPDATRAAVAPYELSSDAARAWVRANKMGQEPKGI